MQTGDFSGPDKKNEHGFTLLELIMVIVIIGILAWVAIQKYPTTEISLETAADMIRSDIRSVQALAMSQHTAKSMTFASTIYTFDIQGGTQQRNLTNIFDGNISLSPYPASISFNSLGEPTSTTDPGDTITITNGSSITLTVLRYTGRVE